MNRVKFFLFLDWLVSCFSVLREVGQATLSTLSWKFNSSSHAKVKETFKKTFGTLTFKTGEIEKVFTLEVH